MGSSYGSKLDELLAELQAKVETADQPLDVSSVEVDVDLNSLTYGNLPVEQQTPVGIEDTVGTQIDPLSKGDQPLDVSSAEVDVDINTQTLGALTVAAHGINDTGATQIDPSIKGNQLRELENIGTAKRIYGYSTTNSVLYTVPTGTTFYLLTLASSSDPSGTKGGGADVQDDTATTIFRVMSDSSAGPAAVATFEPPFVMPAGYGIRNTIVTNGNTVCAYGYEV